jgi:hypothetical protein
MIKISAKKAVIGLKQIRYIFVDKEKFRSMANQVNIDRHMLIQDQASLFTRLNLVLKNMKVPQMM